MQFILKSAVIRARASKVIHLRTENILHLTLKAMLFSLIARRCFESCIVLFAKQAAKSVSEKKAKRNLLMHSWAQPAAASIKRKAASKNSIPMQSTHSPKDARGLEIPLA
jgi:hypothetical protein